MTCSVSCGASDGCDTWPSGTGIFRRTGILVAGTADVRCHMTLARFIRLRDAPDYLGMDRTIASTPKCGVDSPRFLSVRKAYPMSWKEQRLFQEPVAGRASDQLLLGLSTLLIVHNGPMNDSPPPRHPITCEIDGKTFRGTYWVAGKILTVATGGGGKSKRVGTMEPGALAKQLLLNLVKSGKT